MDDTTTRVLILGGGFAGLNTAAHLEKLLACNGIPVPIHHSPNPQ